MILYNRHKIKCRRILVLSTILISFFLSVSLKNLEVNANSRLEEQKYTDYDFQMNNLKSQDLTSDNSFTGIGAPWNVTHYANYTKSNLEISFNNNSYDASQQIKLDSGWAGYQLNSTINNLFITRNLVNGTFHCGTDNGYSSSADDSNDVLNWTFSKSDAGSSNDMSGNYYDGVGDSTDGSDCLELRIHGRGTTTYSYDQYDKCWWLSEFTVPQDEIEQAQITLALNPKFADTNAGHFTFRIKVNDMIVMSRNLYSLYEQNGGNYWNEEEENIDNIEEVFPLGVNNANITLEFERTGGSFSGYYYSSYGVLVDNVSLVIKAKAKPTELELKLNSIQIDDAVNNGEGYLEILSNWDGDLQPSVIANFSSNLYWPLVFDDAGTLKSYKIEFKTDLTLYINKFTPESYYLADPDLSYQGSSFITSNNSIVNWTTYAHMEIPVGYEETNMTVEYPSDYNLTGLYFSNSLSNSLSQTYIEDDGNKKVINVPVSSITSNTNGFWRLKAVAPNYSTEMDIYNNATGDWELNNEFLSGEYIKITAKINNSNLISSYITTTKAQLRIRFPSGSLWDVETQLKSPDSNGLIQFDAFQIPDSSPYYEAGQYQAIVTWNNSYSIFGLNETGIIYKKFMVIHDSYLVADITYFEKIDQGSTINLKVSFYDSKDLKAITNANVSTTDFKGVIKQFSEINPGYYFLEFNTTGGLPGNNYINITAKHPNYEDNEIQITIELIVQTILNAEEYPTLKVAWNNNFTIHLNYTYVSNGTGIENADYTIDWNGEKSTTSGNGLYNVTLNSSLCEVNKVYYLTFTFDKNGCEGQAIIISIEIVSRETYIGSILINDIECIANKTYNIKSGELLNFKVTYNDLESSGIFVKNAIVTLNKSTEIGEIFEENPTYYNLTLSSTDLGLGTSFINIIAKKDNYTSTTVILTIIVFERNTDYKIYLDGIDFTNNPVITTYTNRLINLTVSYIDFETTLFISDAIVDVNGSGVSEVLIESYGNYTIMLNTTELNFGANFLTVYARKGIYEPQSILLAVQIVQIETVLNLYLNGQDKTSNPAITTYTNQLINLTISYKEQVSTLFINEATVDVNGSGVSEVLIESYSNYTIMIDTSELNFGANFLSIYARKEGFEPQSITLTVQIVQIETVLNLYLNGQDKTLNPAITTYANQFINLTVSYTESITSLFIGGATVDVNGSGVSEVLIESYSNYTVVIDTSELNFGANFLTIYARKEGFEPQSITLTVQIVQIETVLNLYLNGQDKTSNPAITTYTNQLINLTISYKEQVSTLFINEATVDVNGSGVSEVLIESYDNYTVMIDTSELNFGANFLTIYARKQGFEPQSIIMTVQIVQIETVLNLYLNNQNKTINPAITAYTNQLINLTISYKEQVSKLFITGAIVDVNGSGMSKVLIESYDNYTIIINTSELNFGANFLTIYARKQGFEPQSITLTVQIVQIESVLNLYLNGQDKTSNPAITTYTNRLINLTVSYEEFISTLFISGAIVDVNGSGVSEVLIESYGNYTIMLDTSELNFGANFLTIYARKQGFEPQSIIITVQIIQIETTLNLYIDGQDETSNPVLTTYTDQLINLTVSYKEQVSTLFIPGATVDVNGSGVSEVLIESYGNYTIMIDTSELNFGANFLTIYARKQGFEPQSIIMTVQIVQIETILNLYLDGQDETSNPELTTYTDQLINFTVSYKEQISTLFISGATVDVNSTGVSEVLIESYDNYTVMIDTSKLRLGANFLTIYARKEGYEPQSIIITVQIIEIETGVNVSLNEQDTTFLTITIRKSLTITVNYFDILSSTAIIDANVQAFVGENVFNLTEDTFNHQYYTTINTSLLDLGFKFLTISCSRQNYQSASVGLTIQVIQIRANVTTSTGATVFTIQPGQNFRLKINLTDLDFNVKVLHALVGYSFPFAKGNLTDDDNDGVYEATINANYLPVGTHEIRIYPIDAGIEYNFPQTYKIYVNVVSPPEDVLLFQVLTILGIGAAVGIGGYLLAYQKVLKYPKKVRKIHKFKSKLKKSKPLGIEVQSRDQILREHYSEHITALEKQIKKKLSPKLDKVQIDSAKIDKTENSQINSP